MISTRDGTQIFCNDNQLKALSPSCRSREFDSNETHKVVNQPAFTICGLASRPKQHLEITSTERGTTIDSRRVQPENVFFSIRWILQLGSNDTLTREKQNLKDSLPRVTTAEGMQIDRKEFENEKA
jgi:hypothetical protein